MTALTQDRNTPYRTGESFRDPVAASVTIFAGSLVCLDASGNAVPGATATTLIARGRAEEQVDNASGSAGDKTVNVRPGVFRFANHGGDAIDRADIGGTAWIVDDKTVAATDGSSSRSAAGVIVDLDADGVWVRVGV
jgi:hypothetical protein